MNKQVFIKPGDKFGRLTALSFHHSGKHHRRYFVFKCDCGVEKILQAANVSSGNTQSCGCLSSEIKRARRLPNNLGVIRHLILQYKRHAKNRGFVFRLSEKFFSKIISQKCFYCGAEPTNNKITKNCVGFLYNGIDRKNSMRGYFPDNVVPACAMCNKAKRDYPIGEFGQWALRLGAMAEQWSAKGVSHGKS